MSYINTKELLNKEIGYYVFPHLFTFVLFCCVFDHNSALIVMSYVLYQASPERTGLPPSSPADPSAHYFEGNSYECGILLECTHHC